MRMLTLAFCLLFIIQDMYAQNYTPLVVEGATWVVFSRVDYELEYRAYKIEGDSTVNSIPYKKVYKYELGSELSEPITYTDKEFYVLLREDLVAKKVYIIGLIEPWGQLSSDECDGYDFSNPAAEYLIYDFDVMVGENVPACHIRHSEELTYTSEDTEFLFEQERVVYNTSYDVKLIEGIAYQNGLFMSAIPITPASGGLGLILYCNENINMDCTLLTNSTELSTEDIVLFPNPTCRQISFPSSLQLIQVELLSLSGARIDIQTSINNTYELSTHVLGGIYFLKVITRDGKYGIQKIIVECN